MPAEAKTRHQLSIMGVKGHAEVVWDVHDYDSITAAKAMFDKLIKDRFTAFAVLRVGDKPGKGHKISAFDPALEEIIFVPPVSGG